MKINIEKKNIKEFKKGKFEILSSFFSTWREDEDMEQVVNIDLAHLSDEAIKALKDCLSKKERTMRIARCLNTINDWLEAKNNPNDKIIDSLTSFTSILKEYVRKSDHYLLFEEVNNHYYPMFLEKIKYVERHKDYPAHVIISLKYYDGYEIKNDSKTFYSEDVMRKRCSGILAKYGLVLENENIFKIYTEQVKLYEEVKNKIGTKYLAEGKATLIDNNGWSEASVNMVVEGQKTPVVVDKRFDVRTRGWGDNERVIAENEFEVKTSNFTCTFWNDTKMINKNKKVVQKSYGRRGRVDDEEVVTDDDTKDSDVTFNAPVHPDIFCFNLIKHENVIVHIDDLELYKYDKELGKKLILPTDIKELLKVLINHSNSSFQDIIAGKAGGTIVLCTGEPGTGKTLTAEVYAEIMERPLYCVQSSQLGVNAEELENELKAVLNRATRWKAILLIDEADVYVHERGSDINQNAIVGVFLRVLEYYKGILFMTTNRDTMIDDAIASRATAKIRYQYPVIEDLKKIWKVISSNSGINIKEDVIEKAVCLNLIT